MKKKICTGNKKNSFVFLFIASTDFSNLLDTFIRLLIRNKLVSSFLTLISGFLRIVFQKGGESRGQFEPLLFQEGPI